MSKILDLPVISINLWAFTSSKDLYNSLKSIVDQDYSEVEILIACSDSAPSIKELAYQAALDYAGIRVFEMDSEQSLNAAQILWDHSRGDYLAPVISGTILNPNALHKLHIALASQQYLNPEISAVIGNTQLFDINGKSVASLPEIKNPTSKILKFIQGLPILSGTSLLDRRKPSPFLQSHLRPYFWWGSAELLDLYQAEKVVSHSDFTSHIDNYSELCKLPGIRSQRDHLLLSFYQKTGLQTLFPKISDANTLAELLEKTARSLIEDHALPALYTALLLVQTAAQLSPNEARSQRIKDIEQLIPARIARDFPAEIPFKQAFSAVELCKSWQT